MTIASLADKRDLMCRYWLANTYEERHRQSQEPQNVDKEFLRLWFRHNCDPYNDKVSTGPSCSCGYIRGCLFCCQVSQRAWRGGCGESITIS